MKPYQSADYFIKVRFPYCSGYEQERIRFERGKAFFTIKNVFIFKNGGNGCASMPAIAPPNVPYLGFRPSNKDTVDVWGVLPYKIRPGKSDKNWPKCPNFSIISDLTGNRLNIQFSFSLKPLLFQILHCGLD